MDQEDAVSHVSSVTERAVMVGGLLAALKGPSTRLSVTHVRGQYKIALIVEAAHSRYVP